MLFFLKHGYRVIATTGADMGVLPSPEVAMTWIITPTT